MFNSIFRSPQPLPLPQAIGCEASCNVSAEMLELNLGLSFATVTERALFTKAVGSMKDLDCFETKRMSLDRACSQWLEIFSCNWAASATGHQVSVDLQTDFSGDSAIRGAFGVKSPSTF